MDEATNRILRLRRFDPVGGGIFTASGASDEAEVSEADTTDVLERLSGEGLVVRDQRRNGEVWYRPTTKG